MIVSSVRYYDYGSMQREAERRVYEMQNRARKACPGSDGDAGSHAQVSVDRSEKRRAIEADLSGVTPRQPKERAGCDCGADGECECRKREGEPAACECKNAADKPQTPEKRIVSEEEMLIASLLLLFLSDKSNTGMILALLYLLA